MNEPLAVVLVVRAGGPARAAALAGARSAARAEGARELPGPPDRVLVACATAAAGALCAIAVMRAAADDAALGIGVDACEPDGPLEDLRRPPAMFAAALCEAAADGEILLSEAVRHIAGPRAPAPTEPAGAVRVAGAPEPVRAVRVLWDASAGTGAVAPERVIRVVIADDQRLVRTGFRVILDDEPDIRVVGEASDGLEAVEVVRTRRPDVVLMDIRMPGLDGLGAAERILGDPALGCAVVMLTTFDASDYVYAALRIGASGFLLKDAPADRLLDAVRVAAAGDALISPSITRRLIERFARAARPVDGSVPAALAHLTVRELDVLRHMARGLSNREIARELVLGENTIKTHVGHVLAKLGARDRAQAVVIAYETDLVSPERG